MTKKVVVKINQLAKKYNLTYEQMSELVHVRAAALNELANGKRQRIQFEHIEKIADGLDIDDIRQIIDLKDE